MRMVPLFMVALIGSTALPALSQTVRGRLLDAESGSAIQAGTVTLLSEDSVAHGRAVTGADGSFLLDAPRPGAYRLMAEHIGHMTTTTPAIDLEDRDTLVVEFRLSTDVVLLQPLTVVVSPRRPTGALGAFHDRARRKAFGTFITRQDTEERHPVYTSDLLRAIPGVQVVPTWWGRAIVLMRGWCVPAIYLDGMRIRSSSVDDLITPMALEGIEVYRSAGEAPAEFTGAGLRLRRRRPVDAPR